MEGEGEGGGERREGGRGGKERREGEEGRRGRECMERVQGGARRKGKKITSPQRKSTHTSFCIQ